MKFFTAIGIALVTFAMVVQFVPVKAYAAGLILIDCQYGPAIQNPYTNQTEHECGFKDAVAQIQKLINLIFILALPITVIALTRAGINILLAQGNMSKITEAKKTLSKILVGFLYVLAGWLIVYSVLSYFVKPEYFNVFLGGQSNQQVTK
jgi:hypothetical protein